MDTTTEEGRAAFKAEYDAMAQMTPELLSAEVMLYPHEMPKQVSTEAHFQRVWTYYREHTLKNAIQSAVDSNNLSSEDASAALKFLGSRHHISVTQWVFAKQGHRSDL